MRRRSQHQLLHIAHHLRTSAPHDSKRINRFTRPASRALLVARNRMRVRGRLKPARLSDPEAVEPVQVDKQLRLAHALLVRHGRDPVVERFLEQVDLGQALIGQGDVRVRLPADGADAVEAPGDVDGVLPPGGDGVGVGVC
jgi:hypothetical protein